MEPQSSELNFCKGFCNHPNQFHCFLHLFFTLCFVKEHLLRGRDVTSVVPNDNFTLTLTFDNGEVRLYDVAPILQVGTVFAPFRDLKNFRRVYLDESHSVAWDIDPNVDSSVVWSNKVDLCPDGCYVDSVPIRGGSANA